MSPEVIAAVAIGVPATIIALLTFFVAVLSYLYPRQSQSLRGIIFWRNPDDLYERQYHLLDT
jgi:hypothetical protein